ncbi:hypothetical protein EB796_018946 [Bugula neritina]|uniref:IPO4/5-like TPR repeats domain-containing protein n=1 Tax=Bugula neritina TaxID=10212 RepID=A0A7J7JBJ3_BUGNE|nr:hypothetical protein EB796_018946 [Bugula neritina]
MDELTNLLDQLSSSKKLDRDRGLTAFLKWVESLDPVSFTSLTSILESEVDKVKKVTRSTELIDGDLIILASGKVIMLFLQSSSYKPKLLTKAYDSVLLLNFNHLTGYGCPSLEYRIFCEMVKDFCIASLTHTEYRVRIAAGECLGGLCMKFGSSIYVDIKDIILSGIRDNLERDMAKDESHNIYLEEAGQIDGNASPRTSTLMMAERMANFDEHTKKIFHDTAGWKNLETFMKCLQSVIDGCGVHFNKQINQELLDLIFTALTHTNRFVRETGYQVCGSLVSCNSQALGSEEKPDKLADSILIFGMQFAKHLASGLADNWSQVRLASSQATRQFLAALDAESMSQYMPLLLPRMCLNRYYVAEGVRIYSQETWRKMAGDDGKLLVQKYIKPTVEFYISQSEADNHAVREAACSCIAELGSKIDKECVRPYVPSLLGTLKVCFEDDSWPVRDAACMASGNFIYCFPEEAKPYLEQLKPLFFENLKDNIPSVRSGAAHSLANVTKVYENELAAELLKLIEDSLKAVENQKANTDKYGGLEKGPATYSVVKQARDNDADLHTNNTMYSCGSLAPKMGRGGSKDKGGCMHSTFRRQAEPWEVAEGCAHLMSELSVIQTLHQPISALLPLLAAAVSHREYTQHVVLLETLCKIVRYSNINIYLICMLSVGFDQNLNA